MVFSLFRKPKKGKFALHLIVMAPLAAGLGGCASQFPVFDNFLWSDPLTTGSTTAVPAPFDQAMAREDWLVAEPSLETALDSSNLDESMIWKQDSGSIKGSFRPAGTAFTKNGQLCRDFTALVEKKASEPQIFSATACRFGAGPWLVRGPRQS